MHRRVSNYVEPIPLCAARVDSLKSHGHMEAALRLAVSVVRTMKEQQLMAQRQWHESQQGASTSNKSQLCKPCTSQCNGQCITTCSTTSASAPANLDGWVGHPLDPIGCLFDTLADASTAPKDQRPRTPSYLGKYYRVHRANVTVDNIMLILGQIMGAVTLVFFLRRI